MPETAGRGRGRARGRGATGRGRGRGRARGSKDEVASKVKKRPASNPESAPKKPKVDPHQEETQLPDGDAGENEQDEEQNKQSEEGEEEEKEQDDEVEADDPPRKRPSKQATPVKDGIRKA